MKNSSLYLGLVLPSGGWQSLIEAPLRLSSQSPPQMLDCKHASLFLNYAKTNFVTLGLGPYSQHFIFFVTYKWAYYSRVFVTGKPFQPFEV